jgi:hypothetical protein
MVSGEEAGSPGHNLESLEELSRVLAEPGG